MPSQIQALRLACNDENLDGVLLASHTIKGIAANLGGVVLQRNANELEQAAKSGDWVHINVLTPKLQVVYDDFAAELSLYMEEA